MAREGSDLARQDALGTQPGHAGAPKIIRRAQLDAGALAAGLDVAHAILPVAEERAILALPLVTRESDELALPLQDQVNDPVARLALGATDPDGGEILGDVLAARALGRVPLGAGADHERDARSVVLRESRHQLLDFTAREPPLDRLILGREADGQHGIEVAAPEAAPLGELEHRAEDDQLLADRMLGNVTTFAR